MKNKLWEIKLGSKIRKIFLLDVFEAFTVAISMMNREIKGNKEIAKSPKVKEKYEFYIAILKLIKDKFAYAGEQEEKKVKLKTAKGRKK